MGFPLVLFTLASSRFAIGIASRTFGRRGGAARRRQVVVAGVWEQVKKCKDPTGYESDRI